jgi:hypothetical protein
MLANRIHGVFVGNGARIGQIVSAPARLSTVIFYTRSVPPIQPSDKLVPCPMWNGYHQQMCTG